MSKYKDFTKNHLDKISPSICYAKWLWSEFNIPYGTTASCNLNPPHAMNTSHPADKLFNTDQKIKERQQMLQGEKPTGCNYCWRYEDQNSVSDRMIKSEGYVSHGYNEKIFQSNKSVPGNIVVIFDTLCNFKCMYCDQSQSTTWEADLRKHGPYRKLYTENRIKYQSLSKFNYKTPDEQKYLTDEFFTYVEENLPHIESICVQGGEPTMSPKFWQLIDFLSNLNASHLTFAIHTNLCPSQGYDMSQLLKYKNKFAQIRINGSVDNIQDKAEVSRFGTNWSKLAKNVEMILENGLSLSFMSTLGALQVEGYLDLCNWRKSLEQKFQTNIAYDLAFVVDPSFQKVEVLPDWYKNKLIKKFTNYMEQNTWCKHTKQEDFFQRIINKLQSRQLDQAHQQDFKSFVKQYASRCGFDLGVYSELADWIMQND